MSAVSDQKAWPPKWPATRATQALILVGLMWSCDDQGAYAATLTEIAEFGLCCTETARTSTEKLRRADCLYIEPSPRDRRGAFSSNIYRLNFENARVRAMFGLVRRSPPSGPAATPQPSSPNQSPSAEGATRRRKTSLRHPEIGNGLSIDTRARAGASSNFLFLRSLPEDYLIGDEQRPIVQRVLSVCGVGLADIRTPGLLDSLVECLFEALEDGYDLELDILPCVKRKTSGHRVEPLWSFRIIFKNDLPEWKRHRLAKEHARQSSPRLDDRKGYGKWSGSSSDTLDAMLGKGNPSHDVVAA